VVFKRIHPSPSFVKKKRRKSKRRREKKNRKEEEKGAFFFIMDFIPEESGLVLIVHAKVLKTWVSFSVFPIVAPTIEGHSRYSQHHLSQPPAASGA
jgi:hypothetical protein